MNEIKYAQIGIEDGEPACAKCENKCAKCPHNKTCDFDWIYKLFGKNGDLLGPIMPPVMKKAMFNHEVLVVDNLGFCEFHVARRLNHVTIYHICVSAEARGQGLGRKFIDYLANKYQMPVQAICIKDTSSEAFWSKVAEKIDSKVSRKGTQLSVYLYEPKLNSETKVDLFS